VPSCEGTLAPPGEYDFTVRLRQQCVLMSDYFDYLLLLLSVLHAGNPPCSVLASLVHRRDVRRLSVDAVVAGHGTGGSRISVGLSARSFAETVSADQCRRAHCTGAALPGLYQSQLQSVNQSVVPVSQPLQGLLSEKLALISVNNIRLLA